jgi:hypothetical protein
MNARDEFIEFTKDLPKVLCAKLEDVYCLHDNKPFWLLKVGYTDQDYKDFLEAINFRYDNDYGSQELGGTIWFEDGTYADRGEYDGSEWWEYRKAPEIPEDLVPPTQLKEDN